MSQDVHFIEIIFENLDCITVPAHYFFDFELDDIRTSVSRAAANAILRYSVANSVMFELKLEANNDAAGFSGDVHCISTGEGSLLDRLQAQDITHITLIYDDKTEEEFSIAWEDDGDDEYHNRLQSAHMNAEGRLCVQIGHDMK